jgi:hypothetical protein
MVECKASKTVFPAMAGPLQSLSRAAAHLAPRLAVIHRASRSAPPTHALAPGVEALDAATFIRLLNARTRRAAG